MNNSSRRPSTALATVSFAAAACGCLAARGAAAFLPPAQLDSPSHNIWTSRSSRRRILIKGVPSWGRDHRHGSSASFQSSRLYGMTPREEGQSNQDFEGSGDTGDDDKKDEELEAARRRFEDMMNTDTTATHTPTNTGSDTTSSRNEEEEEDEEEGGGGSSVKKFLQRKRNQLSNLGSMFMSFGMTEDATSVPPPLTSIARERREAEMEHLASLIDGDESLEDLWSLWFAERGPAAAAELVFAEELAGQGPAKWPEAEKELRNLIEEHGIYWVEPVNRLATLYYMQGRLEESRSLCEMVLSVKPWHFGALSGIVLVCTGLGDAQGARLWASRRLPPVPPTGGNQRRAEWVEHAVDEAHKSLKEAEKQTRKSFGKPDKRQTSNHEDDIIDSSTTNIAPSDQDSFTNDTDAWQ